MILHLNTPRGTLIVWFFKVGLRLTTTSLAEFVTILLASHFHPAMLTRA